MTTEPGRHGPRRGLWLRRLVSLLSLWPVLTGSAWAAETFWGLRTDNTLVRFSSTAPGTLLATLPITGLPGGEQIVGIEVEEGLGRLTCVSSAGRRYQLDRSTGAATPLMPAVTPIAPAGTAFGVTENGYDVIVVSQSGSLVLIDRFSGNQRSFPSLAPARRFVGLAWHWIHGPRYFALDSADDGLHTIEIFAPTSPVTSVGALGVDTSDEAGLELGPHDGVLYAALTVAGSPGLYTVNPSSGQATLVGSIPTTPIVSLTADLQGTPTILWTTPGDFPSSIVPESNITLTFTVRRTGDDTVATVYAMTMGHTSPPVSPYTDYIPLWYQMQFEPGEIDKQVTLTILDDDIREPLEAFTVIATEVGPGIRASGRTGGWIGDDENLAPVLRMAFPFAPTTSVASPTVTLSGFVDDEDAGALVRVFGPGGQPYTPIATTRDNPWTVTVPLQAGANGFRVEVSDIHELYDTTTFSITRVEGTDRTSVLAEGATGAFFSTDLLLANPNDTDVTVSIEFLRGNGTVVPHAVTVPAQQRTTLAVDSIPGLEATSAAAVVTSYVHPIVVERTMRWDASGYGASTEKAATSLSRTWYFAEGSQGFFSTFLLLVNPQAGSNDVTVRFLRESGSPVTRTYDLLPRQRLTIDAGAIPELVGTSFGIDVTFEEPGMAERSMYFGRNALWDAGHESAGAPAAATEWHLAEGASGAFFETFILVANPSDTAADVTLTFLPEGGAPVTRTHPVPANGRLTVNVEQEDPALANLGAIGTRVTSTIPIVVERSQYWPWSPDQWYEAHNSFGQTEAATRWGLAEGRVGGPEGYKTYILLTNASPTAAADISVRFLREGAPPVTRVFGIAPSSRLTIDVGSPQVPEVGVGSFGAEIVSSVPISVERAMYSNANGQFWAAGTIAAATRLP